MRRSRVEWINPLCYFDVPLRQSAAETWKQMKRSGQARASDKVEEAKAVCRVKRRGGDLEA